jgi:hypothetical protein
MILRAKGAGTPDGALGESEWEGSRWLKVSNTVQKHSRQFKHRAIFVERSEIAEFPAHPAELSFE